MNISEGGSDPGRDRQVYFREGTLPTRTCFLSYQNREETMFPFLNPEEFRAKIEEILEEEAAAYFEESLEVSNGNRREI